MDRVRRIGILGGTFDPIHIGHLHMAASADEQLNLNPIIFVPCGTPPTGKVPVVTALDRFFMVEMAIVGMAITESRRFVADIREILREGPSYTVDTLRELKEEYPAPENELFLILGGDEFASFPSWREPEDICEMAHLVCFPRGETPESNGFPVTMLRGRSLPISSTRIRERLAAGKSVQYLLPQGVLSHIRHSGLYGDRWICGEGD
jgi:nicotinate-nucleotide adenylyltransferase